jgi:hypothetical protein
MSKRWLIAVVLFGLGFICALLVQLPAASAAPTGAVASVTTEVIEGGLKYVDGDDLRLVYPPGGKAEYLVVVSRKTGAATNSEPIISAKTGLGVFSKKDLQSLTVYRVTPLIQWRGDGRSSSQKALLSPAVHCGRGPYLCPLPPPPPPLGLRYTFFRSGNVQLGKTN